MSPRFFLSYARANKGPLVRRFFEDLSLTIGSALSLPPTQPVGFFEEIEYGPGATWSDGAARALQTCQAMVCLLSTSYFHSELAGKEWQIFEMRQRRYREHISDTRPESQAPVIMPVSWIAWHGPTPKVVSEMLAHPNHIHQRQAIMSMLKSSSMNEYAEFVKTLAYKIIDITEEIDLPLESILPMKDVHNAFYLWEESPITSDELRIPKQRSEHNLSNAESGRTMQVEDQATAMRSEHSADVWPKPQSRPASPSTSQTQATRYSTFAISKNRHVLDMIEDSCRFFPFEVRSDENFAHAMHRIRLRCSQKQELPELFVIDLDEGPEGLEAVKELSESLDVPSGILSLSSNFDSTILYESKGATVLYSPFDGNELIEQMELCAKIGRDIRSYRTTSVPDSSRKRQVFLSYRSKDRGLATVLRRSLEAQAIGVSYMDEIEAGKWKHKIESWIGQAQVFLALVTENYLTSKYCEGELRRFTYLLDQAEADVLSEKERLHLISVLYNSPDTHNNDLIEKCKSTYQHLDMSDADFLMGLSTLVTRIQGLLAD